MIQEELFAAVAYAAGTDLAQCAEEDHQDSFCKLRDWKRGFIHAPQKKALQTTGIDILRRTP